MEIRPILSAMMRSKTGAILIAAQIALTLGILCNALYIVNDRLALANRPSGADEDNTFLLRLFPFRKVADIKGMQLADEDALRRIPGVVSFTWTNEAPLSQSSWNTGFATRRDQKADSTVLATTYMTAGSLVNTLGLKVVEGRDFTADDVLEVDPDTSDAMPQSAIITSAFAKKLYPNERSALGKPLYYATGENAKLSTIVGVVERLQTPRAQAEESDEAKGESSVIYPMRNLVPYSQYLVRTQPGQRAAVIAAAEKALSQRMDGRVLLKTHTLNELRESRYRADRALAGMLVAVVVLLLLVTASGIVGMASLLVNQRRKQIGVRRALGARRFDILRYFLTENAMVTTGGIVGGIALALGLNQLLVSTLELQRLPLGYLGVGMVALWALGLLAVLGPAWRAARVPPAVATRSV
ncbi:MAG TPA: FtsX-like permease family protein [Xanthomonadaceae bacterium]|jgi:putative ABC transport system permease protein|nr:FtsX-like permease family protein [Xanthomonadaceae bacterium]